MINNHGIAGSMLMHSEEPETLIGNIKGIENLCQDVLIRKNMGPIEFAEDILASGYSIMTSEYMKNKYLHFDLAR